MIEFNYNKESDTLIGLQRMRSHMRNTPEKMRIKPVPELKYLNAENVHRYRLIMRYFYEQYKRLRYWLSPEEVYRGVIAYKLIDEYTQEQCQQDLEVLTEWKNLSSRHDGSRANTVEEYKRKKFRYLLTPYSIEIERMLDNLESIQGYGGSLEATLFDQIIQLLQEARDLLEDGREDGAYEIWKALSQSFKQLHENASDYLASLQTGKVEELMMTESFLVFKDTLTHYLRNFIQSLQKSSYQIEGLLKNIERRQSVFLEMITQEQMQLPNIEDERSYEERYVQFEAEWQSFLRWFLGEGDEQSDIFYLEQATKETITKVVRAVLRIQEKRRLGASRKRELDYLGQWFFQLDDLDEAGELAAYTLGLYKTRHFQGMDETSDDRGYASMLEDAPIIRHLRSRSRKQVKRTNSEPVRQTRKEQQRVREDFLNKQRQEAEVMEALVRKERFSLSDFPRVSKPMLDILLYWIGRCSANPSRKMDTPDGLRIEMNVPETDDRTVLQSEAGDLELPNFSFIIARMNQKTPASENLLPERRMTS